MRAFVNGVPMERLFSQRRQVQDSGSIMVFEYGGWGETRLQRGNERAVSSNLPNFDDLIVR